MNELALFAGAGGGILGGKLCGFTTVCAVEIDAYCRRVLMQRQNEGVLPAFPIWDDVRTFDGAPWRGSVDIVTGGFPCQDISVAGAGAGIDGESSGLWREMARIIGEVRPAIAFVENSPALTLRGLDRVLGDLSSMGFDARWGVVSAQDAIWAAENPAVYHERGRIWIVAEDANANSERWRAWRTRGLAWSGAAVRVHEAATPGTGGKSTDAGRVQGEQRRESDLQRRRQKEAEHARLARSGELGGSHANLSGPAQWQGVGRNDGEELASAVRTDWWATEPALGRVANGVANRVDRLRAIGNGQVPLCMALAFQLLAQSPTHQEAV